MSTFPKPQHQETDEVLVKPSSGSFIKILNPKLETLKPSSPKILKPYSPKPSRPNPKALKCPKREAFQVQAESKLETPTPVVNATEAGS